MLPSLHQQFHTFPAPAKLNLFLHIVGRRADGYHELETVFQFLQHCDTLQIRATDNIEITLLTAFEGVDHEDNLIVKAAKLLQSHSHCTFGAEISIEKILPMGGGLGGGSSNAATVLLALNTLWQLNLPTQTLADLGVKLGADVPIFIHGFSAFAQGIGEKLTPVLPKEYYYLVSKPDVSISTQSVFTDSELTRNTPHITDPHIESSLCHNDCQTLVIKRYPEVAKLLAWLIEYAPSQMTGTGACIFSRFETIEQAKKIQQLLPKNITSFVAKGVNISPMVQVIKELTDKLNA